MDKLMISIVFLLLGFLLRYWINRRKFNRRGVAGLEGFSNYEKATAVQFLERLGKILSIFLILIGILFFYGYYRNRSQKVENENKVGLEK